MAVLKLSQIAAAGAAPAATDQLVGVTTGTTDNLFSLTQINTSVLNTIGMAVGSAKITGGTNQRILFDNAGVLGEYTAASANSFLGTATGTGANTDVVFWTGTSTVSGDAGFTYGGQGTNPMVTIATGTITTNVKALNITSTWNAGGVTFDAPIFVNVTNTASSTSSMLVDLQAGGNTLWSFLPLDPGGNNTPFFRFSSGGTNRGGFRTYTGGLVWDNGAATNDYLAIRTASDPPQGIGFDGASVLGWNGPGNGGAGGLDVGFSRRAAGIVSIQNPSTLTNASSLHVYNTVDTGTGTPTNFERFIHDWNASANVATLGTQNGGTGSARAMNIITGGTNAITISTAQAVAFPGVGTTGSAANAFLDNAASNNLLRSTSSLRYKTAVTEVPNERIQALMALQPIEFQSRASTDNPDIRFVGYAAEEVALIDPALVSLDREGRPDSVMYDRVLLLKVAALELAIKEMRKWRQ